MVGLEPTLAIATDLQSVSWTNSDTSKGTAGLEPAVLVSKTNALPIWLRHGGIYNIKKIFFSKILKKIFFSKILLTQLI
jgi:hypothetical protein